ncbi:MAG: biotin--[acetyl-CoA-carboxylase] ligase [Clostridiales bacterium]|nr:biotin--[acetyl-CoA-carboxylase] ligase [Clostridiales bacterium]
MKKERLNGEADTLAQSADRQDGDPCDMGDALSARVIADHLNTSFMGRPLLLLSSVDSTNLYLKNLASPTLPSGYAVVADGQTGGRGSRNRPFLSERGQGIYLSLFLRPDRPQPDLQLLTVCGALAAANAVEAVCGIRADIKWVNDLYCMGKKLCGILCEAIQPGNLQQPASVVVGIGLNTGRLPEPIRDIATSVLALTGKSGLRNSLIAELLNQFEALYLHGFCGEGRPDLLAAYDSRLYLKHQRVLVTEAQRAFAATLLGVDQRGALVVREDGGALRQLIAAEIRPL